VREDSSSAIELATEALRNRSVELLSRGFAQLVDEESSQLVQDWRDTLVALTPFVDCARRLGYKPATVLQPIAARGSPEFRRLFDGFVRRADVTLAAFAWELVETPAGPAYRSTLGDPGAKSIP
jgi:hypothetical protein